MPLKTFVEAIESPSAAERCSWAGCQEPAAFRVGRRDTEKQANHNASLRAMCRQHGLAIQQMVDQARLRPS